MERRAKKVPSKIKEAYYLKITKWTDPRKTYLKNWKPFISLTQFILAGLIVQTIARPKTKKKIGFINSVIIDPLSFVNTRCLCTFIPILIKLLTSDKADLDLPLIFHIPCIVCEHESWSLSISNVLIRVETFYFVNTLMRVGKQCDSLFLTFRLFLKTLMYAYLK